MSLLRTISNGIEAAAVITPDGAWVGIMDFANSLKEGQVEAMDELIVRLETAGFNVLPCFGPVDVVMQRFVKPRNGQRPVDLLLAFSLKFASSLNDDIRQTLIDLNVPVFNVIRPYAESIDEWRGSSVRAGTTGNWLGGGDPGIVRSD